MTDEQIDAHRERLRLLVEGKYPFEEALAPVAQRFRECFGMAKEKKDL